MDPKPLLGIIVQVVFFSFGENKKNHCESIKQLVRGIIFWYHNTVNNYSPMATFEKLFIFLWNTLFSFNPIDQTWSKSIGNENFRMLTNCYSSKYEVLKTPLNFAFYTMSFISVIKWYVLHTENILILK